MADFKGLAYFYINKDQASSATRPPAFFSRLSEGI